MKKVLFIALTAIAFMSCKTQEQVLRRDGFLKYDGKNYTFEPLGNWYKYQPTKTNDTLFQYVIVKKQK